MNQRENSADREPFFFLPNARFRQSYLPEGLHRDSLLSSKPASEAAYQEAGAHGHGCPDTDHGGARMATDIRSR